MEPSTYEPRARNGARLAPATKPGFRKGMPAPNKGMKLPTETYTWAEMNALINACSTRGACGKRDAALLSTQFRTGARINELLSAEARDFDLAAGDLYIRYPKRDKNGVARPRHVPLDARTVAVLERWVPVRRRLLEEADLGAGRHLPMFCVVDRRTRGRKMHGSVWRERLKALGEKAGIEKRVHSHGFRKTCAVDMHIHEGAPLRIVQEILGHQDLSTTAIYLRGPAAAAAAARYGRARLWPDEEPATPDVVAVLAAALQREPGLLAQIVAAAGH